MNHPHRQRQMHQKDFILFHQQHRTKHPARGMLKLYFATNLGTLGTARRNEWLANPQKNKKRAAVASTTLVQIKGLEYLTSGFGGYVISFLLKANETLLQT
jgi:hypothetical protein